MLDRRTSASLQAAFLFLIIGSPLLYKLTNKLLGNICFIASNGCATDCGLVLHAIVFGLIIYLLMGIGINSYFPIMNSTKYIETQDTGVSNTNKTPRHPPVTPPHLPAELAAQMGPKTM
jgi:hypothetical protein